MSEEIHTPTFVHLRLHTDYALIDGTVRIDALMQRLVELGMPAVAVTDETNLFGLIKFQQAAMRAGIKPIFGADCWMLNEKCEVPTRITLLVKDFNGYRNLTQLVSKAYQIGQRQGRPFVDISWLKDHAEGLIVLSGAMQGGVGLALKAGRLEQAQQLTQQMLSIFEDRFYLEVQRLDRSGESDYINAVVQLARDLDVPLVATNDVRFLMPDEFDAHEVRTCIASGHTLEDERRDRQYSPQQYLRSSDEMTDIFADLPQALANSVEIAKRCNLVVPLGTYHLPVYEVPSTHSTDTYFRMVAQQGLDRRLEKTKIDAAHPSFTAYSERLAQELDIIIQMGFAGYFLIVMDFIQWAKQNGVPVGPGRGSGAGSLVAFALNITDLDPITYDLLFERFLNPERVSMPDFDVDFCMEGRDRVIEYVAQKYGREAVSQIITYGTMAAKAVVRDVGRVLGKPYGFVDRIAKLVPFEIGMTLSKALEQEEQLKALYDEDDEVQDVLNMALKLEGLTRNVGKHAGGVVIAPSKLTDHVPLYCDDSGHNLVTQFDKDDVEKAGLVKFDFLGLRTLTIVNWTVLAINAQKAAQGEAPLGITDISLTDEKTYKLMSDAKTTAVFQLESRGMKDLIKRLLPNCFEDIVALVALFRPGPLQSGMVDDFINRKHGRAQVAYSHADLQPILEKTYGVILYQEQVMQIAQVLAGYTLGGADMLRRAMGKKKSEEMAKQRKIFTEGALARGIEVETATYIFDLMEKFAGYGFNKSHSAAYALLSYQTAWLKTHYPAYFMAAVLSSDMHNTDKVVNLVDECKQMGLALIPPSVNLSQFKFSVLDPQQIVYGLGAIKGVGEGPIDSIVRARDEAGDYKHLLDFCRKIDLKKINKRTFEALIKSGALDCLHQERATLWGNLERAIKAATQIKARSESGMQDLLDALMQDEEEDVAFELTPCIPWSEKERLIFEKQTLGLFLSGHPMDEFSGELPHWGAESIRGLKMTDKGKTRLIAGLVIAIRVMRNKRGERMGFVTLDDQTARLDVAFFGDKYQAFSDLLEKGEMLIVEGEVSFDQFSGQQKMVVQKAYTTESIRQDKLKAINLKLSADRHTDQTVDRLKHILKEYKAGPCRLRASIETQGKHASFDFSDDWSVHPKTQLIKALKTEVGDQLVELEY